MRLLTPTVHVVLTMLKTLFFTTLVSLAATTTAPKCRAHEILIDCTTGGCSPRNCSQLGFPVACVKVDPKYCRKGCVCEDGYLWNDKGICIPIKSCPSCGGDRNAVASVCGNNCGNTCANYKKKNVPCPEICKINSCECRKGYVYDDNQNKCVLPKNCTPTCKLHEVYSECTNSGCSPKTCDQLGKPVPCVKIDPAYCIKGCVCEEGYVRNSRGVCILKTECPKSRTSTGLDCSAALQRFYESNMKFTVEFLNGVVGGNPSQSVIMSPFSVLAHLAIFASYTDQSKSYKQLMSVLNLRNKDEIRCVFPEIIKTYQSKHESILKLANKIYVNNNNKLTEKFKEDNQIVFNSEAEAIDFSNSKNASDTINKWVAEKTDSLIQDLVHSGMFSSLTKLLWTNAIYFLGSWDNQFNPDNTRDRDFFVDVNETKPIKTMFTSGSFKFANVPSLDAKVLEIPYKGGEYTYMAFLPNANDGNDKLVLKLQDTTLLNNALDQLSYKNVDVFLPRYETTSSLNLILLEHLNVTDLFNAVKSNLNGIIEGSEKLFISDAIHKAKITVNEVGAEAPASNGCVVSAPSAESVSSVSEQAELFDANHPFIYFIFKNRSPLFAGAVAAN